MPDDVQPLVDIREDETFLDDKRQLEAAEIYAREFAAKPIEDEVEAGRAADVITALADAIKDAHDHRLAKTEPWRVSVKHVNSHVNELTAKPEAAEKALKQAVAKFQRDKAERIHKEQREAQEELDRKAEEAAEEVQAAAELQQEEPDSDEAKLLHVQAHQEAARAAVAKAPAPPVRTQVSGAMGKVYTKTEYKATVVDFDAVPDDYKTTSLNQAALKAALKGEREMAKAQGREFNFDLIPGVLVTAEEVPVRGRRS